MTQRNLRRGASIALLAASLFSRRALAQEPGFSEIWAYLLTGEERFLGPTLPVSDVAYFGAGLSPEGRLVGVPDPTRLAEYSGRVHLVVSETGNYALTHFCLDPDFPLRDALVEEIAVAAEGFDGVQIDFEAVRSVDCDLFFYFLCVLKQRLGVKALSVALPARTDEAQDRWGYERIGRVADRVVVMAYDEHWSASEPGPVASLEWCAKVAAYAASMVEGRKLVMGAPFYGRAWADKTLSRAYKYSGVAELLAQKGIAEVQRQGDMPYIEYGESVLVKVFFEDAASAASRLGLYRAASVLNVAFWRLGQEDPAIWGILALSGL
jgi:spore germination protein